MRKRNVLFFVILVILLLGITILGSVQTKKEFVAACTVKVTIKNGNPVVNLRISESWDANSYDIHGGQDIRTNSVGIAMFPAQYSIHSALYWSLSPLLTRVNYGVHASTGTVATIGISEPGMKIPEGVTTGFTCMDNECLKRPLEFEITLEDQ